MDNTEIWSNLSQDLKWNFETNSKNLTFKRGDLVYRQGDSPVGIYFVKSGLVGLRKCGPSGKEHLLRFFRQGQFFGHRSLFSKEDYHGSAIVLEPTSLKLVPQEIIKTALTKHPELLIDVVQVLARELRRCESQHVMILDNQINSRVAQSIVYLKDLNPDHNWTRQEIADFCASTVSTVIKSLAELEALGLIKQDGRSIQILNRDQLVSMQDDE